MGERKKSFPDGVLYIVSIIAGVATIFSCALAILALFKPQSVWYVIEQVVPAAEVPAGIVLTPRAAQQSSQGSTGDGTVLKTTQQSSQGSVGDGTILFEDNFDNGLSPDWKIESGHPIVVSGTLSADQDTTLTVGDPSWGNYQVEFSVKGGDCCDDRVIAVRVVDSNNMVGFTYSWCYGCFTGWYVLKDGQKNKIPNTDKAPSANQIRLVAQNNKFSVFSGNELLSSFYDDSFQQGKIALMIGRNDTIDNFRVTALP